MKARDSSSGAAALAVCVAALLVGGCGGGGGAGKTGTKVIGGSNNTSVCAYAKRFGSGRIYAELSVSPRSLKETACHAFARSFGGALYGGGAPILPRGTGRPHCDFNKIGPSYKIELGVFATPHTGAGRAFCRSFHPGHGFKRVSVN